MSCRRNIKQRVDNIFVTYYNLYLVEHKMESDEIIFPISLSIKIL